MDPSTILAILLLSCVVPLAIGLAIGWENHNREERRRKADAERISYEYDPKNWR